MFSLDFFLRKSFSHHLPHLLPNVRQRRLLASIILTGAMGVPAAKAQGGQWRRAVSATPVYAESVAETKATAADGAGNVYITGAFSGAIKLGAITLTSKGETDVFVAKWSSTSGQWVWAIAGGGKEVDSGNGIAVAGSSVYVTGSVMNNNSAPAGKSEVQFGDVALPGASPLVSSDAFVLKLTDAGTSATVAWAQAGGGSSRDVGNGIAVNGSNVYVVGTFVNNNVGASGETQARFGALKLPGASKETGADMFLVKYQDAGSSATAAWARAGGGTAEDNGAGVAVSGANVYVTGDMTTNQAGPGGVNKVQFSGTFLRAASASALLGLPGVNSDGSSRDMYLVKYSDAGASATVAWAEVGGGLGDDTGRAVAVSGNSVFVVGSITNDKQRLAGAYLVRFRNLPLRGSSIYLANDAFLVKYTDSGSTATPVWAESGGGEKHDCAYGVAVSGNAVYVTGSITSNKWGSEEVLFSGKSVVGGSKNSSIEAFVAKYVDAGPAVKLASVVVGGGSDDDSARGIAIGGSHVYVVGTTGYEAFFGSSHILVPPNTRTDFLAEIVDNGLLGTKAP